MIRLTILFAEVKRWLFYRMPDAFQRRILIRRWAQYVEWRHPLRATNPAMFERWCYGPDFRRLFVRCP